MEKYSNKKNLVTGGPGFLGPHLFEKLLSHGHEVICVDNYFIGSKNNVKHLMDNPKFELIHHDITFPIYIEADSKRKIELGTKD